MKGKESTIIIELQYLPCVAYFTYLTLFDRVIIDIGEQYVKQSYRNRCRINGANKVENLIIPIRKNSGNQRSSDIKIDYQQKWMNNHMRAIQSAYGKAPFFEYYAEEIFEIYSRKPLTLIALNQELLTKCLEFLELQIGVEFKSNIENNSIKEAYNAKSVIHPKKDLPQNTLFSSEKYFQVFGKNFVPNLSVIDLIFCEGPGSGHIIKKSISAKRQI